MMGRFRYLLYCTILFRIFFSDTSMAGASDVVVANDGRNRLVWAVFAYLGEQKTRAQYAPIANYLNQTLREYQIDLRVMPMDQVYRGIDNKEFNLVTTNPTHFLVVRNRNPLTGVIATLVPLDSKGAPVYYLGGCIVSLAGRKDLESLDTIRGQRLAMPSTQHMGGYRAQAFEFFKEGNPVENAFVSQAETGTHQAAIFQVLEGKADIAFVRTGVIEDMAAEGLLNPDAIQLINPKEHQGFDMLCSTDLYPEWPVFALPHTDERAVRQVASALLALEPDNLAAREAKIAGYTIPADYLPTESLARSLRLPPFATISSIRLLDIWRQYWQYLLTGLATAVVIASLAGAWLIAYPAEQNAPPSSRRVAAIK
jgi:ABC-type phosphate/phosphonate transport system substrate-binding protein